MNRVKWPLAIGWACSVALEINWLCRNGLPIVALSLALLASMSVASLVRLLRNEPPRAATELKS